MTKNYRDARTGQYTTAADAAARPAETVAEAVPERVSLPEDYREAIGQAIGAASMCWTPRPSDAVFDSTAALAIADELIARFGHMTEARDNARAEVERLTALVAEVRETAEHYYGQGYANGSAAVLRILDGGAS